MPKRQHKVTPPSARGGGVRTLAGCHDPHPPAHAEGSRIEGVIKYSVELRSSFICKPNISIS